jgi:sugar (pentulose or hexulose) kinase
MLCAVDLGTTGIKAGIYSPEGELLAVGSTERGLELPRPGLVEQSPVAGWELLGATLRGVLARNAGAAAAIEALVLSTQRGTFVAVDEQERPLTNLISWMDRRGLAICSRLKASVGLEHYYAQCGHPINPYIGLSKLLWVRETRPDLYERVKHFVPEHALFHRWLGADALVCDTATASFFAPFDVFRKTWNEPLLTRLGLAPQKLARLAPATAIVGELSPTAAEHCGLRPGIKLVLGGGDGQCAGVGSGAVEPGTVMINFGTGTGVQTYLPAVKLDPKHNLNCAAHVVPYAWEMEGHTQASGAVFRWVRDELAPDLAEVARQSGRNAYDGLTHAAEPIPAGAEGLLFLPTFNGLSAPLDFADARGGFVGLTLKHTRAHLVRAVMEGTLLEIRWLVEAIERMSGPASDLRAVGGAAASPVWCQMMADVLQRPINVLEVADATLTGLAQIAAVALQQFPDFQAASRQWVHVQRVFEPDRRLTGVYGDLYAAFTGLYDTLQAAGVFTALGKVEGRASAERPAEMPA